MYYTILRQTNIQFPLEIPLKRKNQKNELNVGINLLKDLRKIEELMTSFKEYDVENMFI